MADHANDNAEEPRDRPHPRKMLPRVLPLTLRADCQKKKKTIARPGLDPPPEGVLSSLFRTFSAPDAASAMWSWKAASGFLDNAAPELRVEDCVVARLWATWAPCLSCRGRSTTSGSTGTV